MWRWLEQAVRRGLVRQEGSGKRTDPFRYWLPGREEMMRPDVGASDEEMQAWNQRIMKGFWQGVEAKGKKGPKVERQVTEH